MTEESEQLSFVAGESATQSTATQSTASKKAKKRPKPPIEFAATDPVASVAVDISLPHLDRYFDYCVPESMSQAAQPGVRVRVRFAGKLVDGFILERRPKSDSQRALSLLVSVVSDEVVLPAELAFLCRRVADRYAGSLADVLRSAIPPRHAATEMKVSERSGTDQTVTAISSNDSDPWHGYVGGSALVERIQQGKGPRAVWTVAPGDDWAAMVAALVANADGSDIGSLVVVPDSRDIARLGAALDDVLGHGRHSTLTAEGSAAQRYGEFLRALRGEAGVVIGTRAASFAPVQKLGLIVIWDDGDDSLVDPRAPYWHARDVLAMRAELLNAAFVVGSTSRSVECASMIATGWAREVVRPRADVRERAPRVTVVGGASASDREMERDPAARSARMPHLAWAIAKDALRTGPVLVQVPRRGYIPALSCQRCRAPARCAACSGPLSLSSGHAIAACSWCGRLAGDWKCPTCSGTALRAMRVGERRTADELGRAFPGVPVITSGRDNADGDRAGRDNAGHGKVDRVDSQPALVVCTPGAEPIADGGYSAALLLDTASMLARPDLRAAEEALRRWMNVVSLVRPRSSGESPGESPGESRAGQGEQGGQGGQIVVHAESDLAVVQALVRHDPAGFAENELRERSALRLPPTWRVAELVGAVVDVASLLSHVRLPDSATVLGPVPYERAQGGGKSSGVAFVRALVSAPIDDGIALATALRAGAAIRSAGKLGGPVTIRLDPVVLG